MKRLIIGLATIAYCLAASSQCSETLLDSYLKMCYNDSISLTITPSVKISWDGTSDEVFPIKASWEGKYAGYLGDMVNMAHTNCLINEASVKAICKDICITIWLHRQPTLKGYYEWRNLILKK